MRPGSLVLTAAVLAGCSTTTSTAVAVRAGPPVAGNSVDAVIAWVEAGPQADQSGFHTAENDGRITHLGTDVAFRTPEDLTSHALNGCMTYHFPNTPDDQRRLSCLLALDDGPAKPAAAQGQWVGGWVNFDGPTVTVGGLHGDPGPFIAGRGRPLPYGERLKFGDYQCRSDPSGLYCVNYPHRSAVLLGTTVIVWGCLEQPDHPYYVGRQYDCG